MTPPRRRSSRLQGSKSSFIKSGGNSSRRLSSLTERDEDSVQTAQLGEVLTVTQRAPITPTTTCRIKPPFEEMHPGHAHSTCSPSFDLRCAKPASTLGPDVQRMMDEVREEALRIKPKLAAERDKERQDAAINGPAEGGGRRIATPRGKVGRFSDIHMAEFKKMDSIAGHASSFRIQPGRLAPAPPSLKRSRTKAQLDMSEEILKGVKKQGQRETYELTTPVKRSRIEEVSNVPAYLANTPSTLALSRSQSILNSLTTPTKASMARAKSVKQPSNIPTTKSMTVPRLLAKSATMNDITYAGNSESIKNVDLRTSKMGFLKSLLRHPAIPGPEKLSSNQPVTTASTRQAGGSNLNKELPSVPTTPVLKRSESVKRFNFTPKGLKKLEVPIPDSPSPSKSGLPRPKPSKVVGFVDYPSLPSVVPDSPATQEVNYPVLYPCTSIPQFSAPQSETSSRPAIPGNFTFRSDKTISFGTSPSGFGASPGQSSVRVVRPSIFPAAMLGSLGKSNKENMGEYSAIPHGISNKKRRRANSDNEEDERANDSPAKRHKGAAINSENLTARKIQEEKMAPKSKIPSPSKKSVLSLSRLNMLARPKVRN